MKVKTYYVEFLFRTGQKLVLNPEKITLTHTDKSLGNELFVDGVALARLGRGLPNYDQNNNYYLYNARPTQAIYDLMPDDWDKTQTSLKVIDEIFVRTRK